MPDSILAVRGLCKEVQDASGKLAILRDISFALEAGQTAAIVGASGSGKSTLLGILAGLDTPTAGTVHLAGQDLFALDEDQRAALRARHVGFVFQSFQLMPNLTALENVMLPMLGAAGFPNRAMQERAEALLESSVGRVFLPWRLPGSALVALDATSGRVRALVGGYDFFLGNFNRVTQARRQVGSGFKPFLYTAALSKGYTPASIFLDAPVVFTSSVNPDDDWRPGNYEGKWFDPKWKKNEQDPEAKADRICANVQPSMNTTDSRLSSPRTILASKPWGLRPSSAA